MPASLSTWWFYLPLLDRSAARAIDAIDDHVGKSLCDVAAGIREVDENADRIPGRVKRTDEIDQETDLAWGSVR